jgi:hypothetical protein
MRKALVLTAMLVASALLLSACLPDVQSAVQTSVAATQQISQLQTAAAQAEQQSDTPDEGDAQPQEDTQPEEEAQPQQEEKQSEPEQEPDVEEQEPPGPPTFTVDQDTNCRYGPSASSFDIRRTIFEGETVPIVAVGASPAQEWWVVEVDGVQCWVWMELGSTSGDTSGLPRFTPPAAATATNTPKPPAAKVTFYIQNNQGVDICFVYISPSTSATWGPDRLGADVIPAGGTYYFTFSPGTYDFRLEDCGQNYLDGAMGVTIDSNTVGFTSP